MYRLVIFENGGTVLLDKNEGAIQNSVVNELITKECIEKSLEGTSTLLRLGNSGEFTAKLKRNPEQGTNVALVYPAAVSFPDPQALVTDVDKIFGNVDEKEKLNALVDVRLKSFTGVEIAAETNFKTTKKKGKKGKKQLRTWDGIEAVSDDDTLDFSTSQDAGDAHIPVAGLNALDLGEKGKNGFLVKELSDELGDILSSSDNASASTKSEPFGFLKRYVGGKKLDEADLKGVLNAMEDHLVQRNVAKEVASSICEQVKRDLIGTSTKNWTTVRSAVRSSMMHVLQKILTPATSTDLLASIKKKTSNPKHPYVISVVGVNGVGKSTNLGKLAFWFIQNDFKVLIAACDTFRSGAVEQLKVHVQRLQQMQNTQGTVELFDRGYGKDAAVIAKQGVDYAAKNGFDVVLIDTAGRRHNDDRLMSSLEKFGNLANPDKIIMVGEALVGTDSVEQARNFDAAFGKSRGLDFFLISKCDTVGEMLGTLVNVTYATGVPVLFVGVGQQYTDLRTLNVDWAVDKLMS